MHQFGTHGIGKTADRRFGSAVSRLQRDRPPGERRARLNNHPPIPGRHHLQRRAGTVHVSEVGHLRHPAKLFVAHLAKGRQHGGHGIVDPHIYRAERGFHLSGGALQGAGIGNVGANCQRFYPESFTALLCLLQTGFVPSDQRHMVAGAGKTQRGGFARACRTSGNDHYRHSDLIIFS